MYRLDRRSKAHHILLRPMTKIKAQEGKKCIFCRFLKIWLPGTQPGENLRCEKISFVIGDLPGVVSHKEFTI